MASIASILSAMSGDSSGITGAPQNPAPPPDQVPIQSSTDPTTAALMAPQSSAAPSAQLPSANPQTQPTQTQPSAQPPETGAPNAPQSGGIKAWLSNFLYQTGENAKAQLGIPTDREIQDSKQRLALATQNTQLSQQEAALRIQNVRQQIINNTPAPVDPDTAKLLGIDPNIKVTPIAQQKAIEKILENNSKDPKTLTPDQQVFAELSKNFGVTEGYRQFKIMQAAEKPETAAQLDSNYQNLLAKIAMGQQLTPQEQADKQAYELRKSFTSRLENVSTHEAMVEDAAGNKFKVPLVSTSQKVIPGGKPSPVGPQSTGNAQLDSVLKQMEAKGIDTSGIRQSLAPKSAARPSITPQQQVTPSIKGAAKPILGPNGQQLQGGKAEDLGVAFDPKTNQRIMTNRNDAANSGLVDFEKTTAAQAENMRNDSRRLYDINSTVTDYAKTFDETAPLSAGDKYAIQSMLADEQLQHSIVGEGIGAAMGQIQKWVDAAPPAIKARLQGNLSDRAARRFIDYVNASEGLTGFQKLMTGQGRMSDKIFEVQKGTLPLPNADEHFGAMQADAFLRQMKRVSEGRPIIKGMSDPTEPLRNYDAEVQRRKYSNSKNPAQLTDPRSAIQQLSDQVQFTAGRQLSPASPATTQPSTPSSVVPAGATMKVPGSDGKLHWSDGKRDLGIVP